MTALARRDNDARRVMTKALIEDFWKAWRLDVAMDDNNAAANAHTDDTDIRKRPFGRVAA